jgi:MATE family multidrug resistance protein
MISFAASGCEERVTQAARRRQLESRDSSANLTTGTLWRNIWDMSWPMLLVMLFNFFVGFTDVYVAGFIGPDVQAAVGFVSQFYFLIIIVANAISIGTLALVARAIGAGDRKKALDISRQSVLFSLVVAVALMLPGVLFYRQFIALAGFPPEIRKIAQSFLRIFALTIGPNYLLIISNAVFRASGEVKKPLLTMFIVSLINILGDFFLVFGVFPFPRAGYIGIAISTASSVSIGMCLNLLFFGRGWWKDFYSLPWRLSFDTIRKIASFGWPAALLQVAWNAGTILLYAILSRLGKESVAALAAITNGLRIEAVIYLPAFALNMAASVLIGQNLGAGNPEKAEKVGWKITHAGIFLVSLMALIIFMQAGSLSAILTKSPAVAAETVRYLRINMLSEPFMAMSSILGGGLQGAGDTRGTMWVIIIAMWLVRLPLACCFALILDYGATGVWVAMIISMMLQGILMALRYRGGQWKKVQVD